MGKFDDTGIVSRNQKRTKDTQPHFQGVLNLSQATLKRLLQEFQDTGDAVIRFGMWRRDGEPDRMSLRIDKPFNKDGAKGARSEGQSRREDPPFDDPKRGEARQAKRDDRGFEDPWGDDP